MERYCHHSLSSLQAVSDVIQHIRLDKMCVGFGGVRPPHRLVHRTAKDVTKGVARRERNPREIRKFIVIWLRVERPFMLTPQAINPDNRSGPRRGRGDEVNIGSQHDMAWTPVIGRSPEFIRYRRGKKKISTAVARKNLMLCRTQGGRTKETARVRGGATNKITRGKKTRRRSCSR
ncbi:hypothetical protein BGW80DRAFT_1406247 [Lactifluus volemus]|nr:hypothetical protein BGW80DRAFT_1406247 [Lactifluus volemus]